MFSATIPEELSMFARAGLRDYVFVKLDKESEIPEKIQLHFFLVKTHEKIAALLYILDHLIKHSDSTMIFCSTRYHVDYYAAVLEKVQISSAVIYGKMDQEARTAAVNEFKQR